MNNPILDKNLECIKKYNPSLVQRIIDVKALSNNIYFGETELNEPNLFFNDIPIHSNLGAEAEAKKIFAEAENSKVAINIVLGFGLGYLFKEFAESFKGTVIINEPDIEILRVTLEVADFSQELAKNNVFVSSGDENFKQIFSKAYFYNAKVSISVLPFLRITNPSYVQTFAKNAQMILGFNIVNNNFIKGRLFKLFESFYSNVSEFVKYIPLGEYKDIYEGKTALVVSAGPSLDDSIEMIKSQREKFVIICVSQSIRTLINSGIKPDFMISLEPFDTSPHIEGLDLSDINLILDPCTNNSYYKIKCKNIFLYPSNSSYTSKIWKEYTGIDVASYISSGTVSLAALNSAKILGFKNIIVVGQDLAFAKGKCYSKGARFSDLICSENPETGVIEVQAVDINNYANSLYPEDSKLPIESKILVAKSNLKKINDSLLHVKSVDGNMILTTSVYALFINEFREYAKQNQSLNFYNASKTGALLDGFNSIDLADFFKNSDNVEAMKFDKKANVNIKNIFSQIKKEKDILSLILSSFNENKSIFSEYDNEYSKNMSINERNLEIFREILQKYTDLKMEFSQKSIIYFYIEKALSFEIEYQLKMLEHVDSDSIKILYNLIKRYFEIIIDRLSIISINLNYQEGRLSEMLNTKG